MKKIILSLTLILSMSPTLLCMANVDSPNESVDYKKTSIEEVTGNSEASVLVEDTVTPKCKCGDGKCVNEKESKVEKETCPKKHAQDNKKEKCPEVNEKIEKRN